MENENQTTEQTNTAPVVENQVATEIESEETLIGGSTEEVVESEENKEVTQETKEAEKVEEVKELVLEDFKLPEGVTLDEDFATEFKSIAKDLKLNQEGAQKLVDLQTKFTQTYSEKINTQFKEQVKSWGDESKKELGANYKQELVKVAKAMNTFGSPELRKLLNDTGLGNHKEVVKFFLNIGSKVSEDKMRDPSTAGRDRTSKGLAQRLYTNSNME